MIKSIGKILTIPKFHDFNEYINNENGYELVALVNANLYFIFGILYKNNTRFTSLAINKIKNFNFDLDEYIHKIHQK